MLELEDPELLLLELDDPVLLLLELDPVELFELVELELPVELFDALLLAAVDP